MQRASGFVPPNGKGSADVPRQWLPGFVRWPLRVLLLPWIWLDSAMVFVVQRVFPPPWRLEGACLQRGACCHHVLAQLPSLVGRWRGLAQLGLVWLTQVNGFYQRAFDVELDPDNHATVFGCRYLQADGRCGHYHLRPWACRRYPELRHDRPPQLLNGCGFRVVNRTVPRLPILGP